MSVPALLADIRAMKLDLARLDPRGGMPVRPPPGASAQAVAGVERRLGRSLPAAHRELLELHDGFPSFYQGASLLSAAQLVRGAYVDIARMVIDLGDAASQSATRKKPALFPFGIDAQAETIFAYDLGSSSAGGELAIVIWMNEIGLRVEGFDTFLETVRDMLRGDLAERGAVIPEPSPRRRAIYRCELFPERAAAEAELVFAVDQAFDRGVHAA